MAACPAAWATKPFPLRRSNDTQTGGAPKAYLNYILTDRDFVPVDMGSKPVTAAAREYGQNGTHERLFFDDIVVREAGYMYIYISNEGEELVDVFFDDLKVTHVKSPVIETNDYYPFGLTFNSYSRENSVEQKYLYNGKELQDELDLGWLDYGARMYMADVGRWAVVDPLSEAYFDFSAYGYALSNPIRFLDQAGEYVVQATTNSRNRLAVSAHRIPISAAKFQDNLSNLPIIGLAGYAVKALYASTDPSYNLSTSDHVFAGMSIVGTGLIKGINSALPRDVSRAGVDILNVGFEAAGMASLAVDNNYSELFLDELTFEAAVGTGIATQGIGAADRSINFTDDYVAEVTEYVQNNSKKELTGKRLNRAVQAEITSRLDKTKNNLRQLGQFFDLSTDEGQADFRFVLDALSKLIEEERNKKQDEDEK